MGALIRRKSLVRFQHPLPISTEGTSVRASLQNLPRRGKHPDSVRRGGQVVRRGSAKAPCAGSIPARVSNSMRSIRLTRDEAEHLTDILLQCKERDPRRPLKSTRKSARSSGCAHATRRFSSEPSPKRIGQPNRMDRRQQRQERQLHPQVLQSGHSFISLTVCA